MTPLLTILAIYVGASVLTAGAYALDKRAAVRGRRRVPERTLHTMELLGGWPGALLVRGPLRHKTRKHSYRLTLGAIIALHLAAWIIATVAILSTTE